MDAMSLESLLKSEELSSRAIDSIHNEGFDTAKDLEYITEEDIKSFDMTIRDRCRLRAVVHRVKSVSTSNRGGTQSLYRQSRQSHDARRQVMSEMVPSASLYRMGIRDMQLDKSVNKQPGCSRTGAEKQHLPLLPTMPTDVETIAGECKQVVSGDLPHYQLPLEDVGTAEQSKLRRVEYGQPSPFARERSILVMGETGSGKSTMINGFINHILGVTSESRMRFTIIDPRGEAYNTDSAEDNSASSQTSWITCYTIHEVSGSKVPFTLNIVDTPGFADTRGIDVDKQTIGQINDLFTSSERHGLKTLDAICFVVKSSSTRLTVNHRYVHSEVMSLFGKDLKENICVFCTFADGPEPEVLRCLDKDSYSEYFTFNNAWLLNSCNPSLRKQHFDFNQASFSQFIKFLDNTISKSLQMSIEVLEVRANLEEAVDNLQGFLMLIFGEMCKVDKIAEIIEEKGGYGKKIEVNSMEITKKQISTFNMNCTECEYTCRQKPMWIKRFITVKFKKNTLCRVCECPISKHEFEKFVYGHEPSYVTLEELKKKYVDLDHAKNEVTKEKDKLMMKINKALQRMHDSIVKLNEIALKPVSMTTIDYIGLVIKREEIGQVGDYKGRVELMEKLKGKCELMGKMAEAEYV